jgi:hypothetical protein
MKMSAKDDAVICIENSTGNIYWKGKLVEGEDDFKSVILDWIRGTKNEQLQQRITELEADKSRLREALEETSKEYRQGYLKGGSVRVSDMRTEALATTSSTWLAEHDAEDRARLVETLQRIRTCCDTHLSTQEEMIVRWCDEALGKPS